MNSMADSGVRVTGGVDTHKDAHVAAALDQQGRVLGTEAFPATTAGYRALLRWLTSFGPVAVVGVEGTGAWGAGLARSLTAQAVTVIEVRRGNRQHRRRHGKSDPTDAITNPGADTIANDWAAIRMASRTVPDTYGSGIEPMATMPGRDLNTLWVDGYPADKSPIYSLWEATGPASSCGGSDNKQYWGFVMDESAGQSGGGLIAPCRIYGFGEC